MDTSGLSLKVSRSVLERAAKATVPPHSTVLQNICIFQSNLRYQALEVLSKQTSFISTGVNALDGVLYGGLCRGNLTEV
jgi:hypothetical protein